MVSSWENHLFRLGPSIPWRTVSHKQRVDDPFSSPVPTGGLRWLCPRSGLRGWHGQGQNLKIHPHLGIFSHENLDLSHDETMNIQGGAPKIAKLVYKWFNNGLW